MVVGLSWISGRALVALAAQARGVLVSTPSGCRPLFSPHNIQIHLCVYIVIFAPHWEGLGLGRFAV